MKRSKESTRTFFPDNSLFVSAIKYPERKPSSLDLVLELINNKDIVLVGNKYLISEMERYQKKFNSNMARELLKRIKKKVEIREINRNSILKCKPYFPETELGDIMHAATCLKEKTVLITTDRHFNRIKKKGIIEVWSISKAMKELLK